MQNTRLSTLFDTIAAGLGDVFRNPWRRLAVIIISFLLGTFLGPTISTISGQKAELDIVAAALLVVITELISRFAYGSKPETQRSLLIQVINTLKLGLIYSLFIEAFKLGS